MITFQKANAKKGCHLRLDSIAHRSPITFTPLVIQ